MDSTAKGQTGVLRGNVADYADYDECIEVISVTVNISENFYGKYCLVRLDLSTIGNRVVPDVRNSTIERSFLEPFTKLYEVTNFDSFVFGVCIPSTCSRADLLNIVHKLTANTTLKASVGKYCDSQDETFQLSQLQLIIILLLCGYIGLVMIASLFNIKQLKYFNVIKNINKIKFNNSISDEIKFINGARVMFLILSFGFHALVATAIYLPSLHFQRPLYTPNVPWLFRDMIELGMTLIESMFLISGFLTFCTWTKKLEYRKGYVSLFEYCCHRLIRTMPVMLLMLAFTFIYPSISSAPLFKEVAYNQSDICMKNWWSTVLYVSNWQSPAFSELCLIPSYYISADFQIYVLSYILIILINRKPLIGLIIMAYITIMSMTASALVPYVNNYPPFLNALTTNIQGSAWMSTLFIQTYHHIPPYFSGILIAYLYMKNIQPNKLIWLLGWIVSSGLFLLTNCIPYLWRMNILSESLISKLIYSAFYRLGYISIIFWGFYYFVFNNGGWVRKLFELKIFTPISRVSYSMILSQFFFMFYDIATRRHQIEYELYSLLMICIHAYLGTYILGTIIYILYECPIANLLKAIFKPKYIDSNRNIVR